MNAFLYAQKHRTALKPYDTIVAVMVGTGVGGAIMTDDQLLYGKQGFAGEVGHMVINAGGELKSLEQNCSGDFIPKICKALGIKDKITPYDLSNNTADAKKVKKHIVDQLGLGLANLNLIFNPSAIVLGGSVYRHHLRNSKSALQKTIAKHSLDGKNPLLFDANPKNSAAEGMARMILRKR